MMLSTTLPPELILQILSYFDLHTLAILATLNKSWQNFVRENENTIYHSAAFLEGYLPVFGWTLDDPRTKSLYSERTWLGITNWREFCQRRRQIDNSWIGKGPSSVVQYQKHRDSEHYRRVHRIKVDEKAGYLINTSQIGGLAVTDLETDEILWSLPVWSVRAYAHLEYEQGYAIFDRLDGNKEVWRRTCDIDPAGDESRINNPASAFEGYDQDSRPDERQVMVRTHVNASFPPSGRGHFSPWAILHMPEPSRAYRFVYPNLLVASKERVTRYGFWKWDRTRPLSSRDDETRCDPYRFAKAEHRELVNVPLHPFSGPSQVTEANKKQIIDSFTAVHVSEDGKHIAVLLSGSRLLFLPNFEEAIASSSNNNPKPHRNLELEQKLYLNTYDIQLMPPRDSRSIYLAFNHGRIVVVTSLAVFVLVPEISTEPLDPHSSPPPPTLIVRRIPYFSNPSWLDACSCLMLSETGLFLNYDPSPSQIPRTFLDQEMDSEDQVLHAILMRELEIQDIINNYIDDQDEYEQYHHLPNGDRIVVPRQFAIEISDRSVIFGIDFAPYCHPSNAALLPSNVQHNPPLLIAL
ncbi:hypothetical protein CVT24_007186 [Panaeolus cyanescens]|uniref:F-box domain-containing protein n=1 Tax=Panaeolus cyanescens TaxID=181874 RepID=A0A409VJ89_9AGAR|nr:hypothetical protein CVT24_007186 [Panaeolus cyanescens]